MAAASANLGNGAVHAFLGGAPTTVPERYRVASPAALFPLGVRQWILHGDADDAIPHALSKSYATQATAAGDEATWVALAHADHMALIDPRSQPYQAVRQRIVATARRLHEARR